MRAPPKPPLWTGYCGSSASEPLVLGQVTSISFNLYATSVLIRKGHSIRIALAGADASEFVRIPAHTTPELTYYRTAIYPSSVTLPVKSQPSLP